MLRYRKGESSSKRKREPARKRNNEVIRITYLYLECTQS